MFVLYFLILSAKDFIRFSLWWEGGATINKIENIIFHVNVSAQICDVNNVHCSLQIHDGVTHAAKLYPNAYVIMIVIGTLKGNGAGFTKLLERLIRGAWTPTAMEFMQPSL